MEIGRIWMIGNSPTDVRLYSLSTKGPERAWEKYWAGNVGSHETTLGLELFMIERKKQGLDSYCFTLNEGA